MAFLARLAPFFFFAAFVLLLLVTLSAPIIDAIHIFRLAARAGGDAVSGRANINFGVFGYCVTSAEASFLGITTFKGGRCSTPKLGYRLDSTVARVLGVRDLNDVISRVSTAAFVLNPIATGLTFLAFLLSLFMLCRGANGTSRLSSFLTFGAGVFAALATTAAFVANIIIVALVRKRIREDYEDDISFNWGNGVWMTLASTVALWLALIGALCGVCGGNRRKSAAPPVVATTTHTRRPSRFAFWRRRRTTTY